MKGAKILIVDDEVAFTNNLTKLLTKREYYVTAVNSGDSAIQALEEDQYNIVILDIKMPGMNGITTLKEMHKLGLLTKTIILTGEATIKSAIEALRLGVCEYLTKPCEIDELTEKIEFVLENYGNQKKPEKEE